MKSLAHYLSVPALTFALGVTPTVLIIRPQATALAGTAPANRPRRPRVQPKPKPISIEDICEPKDRLRYRGYAVVRTFNPDTNISSVTIRRGGKVLAAHSGDVLDKDGARVGLFPLLRTKTKQLILMQSSGGAHCCYSFWIYDLYPKFRLILDSEQYPIEDYMEAAKFLDIDKNGVFEFEAPVNSFAYFHGTFSESVMPGVVFKYHRRAKKYYPANQIFSAYALEGIKKDEKEIRRLNRKAGPGDYRPKYYDDYYRYFTGALYILLRYVYAGQEIKGWSFYNREYRPWAPADKEGLRKEIKEILAKDSIHHFLYRR